MIPAERLGLNRWVWTGGLVVVTTLLVTGLRRALHRLAPLAALMELTLVFPDQAPSRSKAALRKSSSRTMLRRLNEARDADEEGYEANHGDYLVQLLQELNAHDRLTRGHSERVRSYAEMLGEELGLSDDDMDRLRWSALLHDVGKLDVPAEILNKDGRPTDEEWAVLAAHPASATRMLEPLADWLGEWIHAADQHHCRWDGNGYPWDLAGTDIALSGRIVAVADAYDVMTSSRSYKKPLSHEVARQELTDCAGAQFDPALVRAFLNISLGRLQAVVGPFAGLAHMLTVPQVRIPILSSVSGASGPALTALAAVGIVTAAGPPADPPPETLAMVADVVAFDASADGLEDEPIEFTVRAEGGTGPLTFRLGQPDHGRLDTEGGPGHDDGQGGWELGATYNPDADFTGSDEVGVEACDTDGRCRWATVSLTVRPVNDAPRAVEDRAVTGAGQAISIDVLANDADIDGDGLVIAEVEASEHGLAVIADGAILYLPDPGFLGLDRIGYVVADPSGAQDRATVVVEVTEEAVPVPAVLLPGANHPPIAEADEVSTDEDQAITIDAVANDEDSDDDAITIIGVGTAELGTATIDDDDTIHYEPNPDANGTDTFLYALSDGVNPPAAGLVTVNVRPVNDRPDAAGPWAAVILETAPVGTTVFSVVADDVDGDIVSYDIDGGDPTGRFDIDDAGDLTVAAPLDHETTSEFELDIEVSDGALATTFRSTVSVVDINEAPVAADDGGSGFVTNEDTILTTPSVLTNDVDGDGPIDPDWITVVGGPGDGTLVDNGDGTFDYDPDPGWSGTDRFTYTVTDDGAIESNQATVIITVDPVNDAPQVTNPGPQAGAVETPFTLQITATDVELDNLSYGATGLPAGLSINGTGLITGTPGPATEGVHSVTVTVTDDGAPPASTPVTFAIDLAYHETSAQAGDIVINEVLYNSVSAVAPEELVELHNSSSGAVDLTGWVLADANLKADGTENLAFTVPATDHWGSPSTLAPGEYAVVWLVYDGANLPPLVNTGSGLEYVVNVAGLKLSGLGDDVWLLDTETRIVDYLAYGGGGQVGTPPEAGLGLWDSTYQSAILTLGAESIALAVNGVDGDGSACWEPTGSDDANGRCPSAASTVDSDSMGALATSVGRHNTSGADAGGPYVIAEGDSAGLDGSGSAGAITYAWDLDNDGLYDDAVGATPTVSWAALSTLGLGDDGVYPVGVQVLPGLATATTSLTVTNVDPTLTTSGAATATNGGTYTLTLGSSDPGDDTIGTWTINWGDGTIDTIVGNPPTVTHTYTGQGLTFDILASATDEDGTYLQNELLVPSFNRDELFRYAPTTGTFLQRFAVNDVPVEALMGPDGRVYTSAETTDDVRRYNAQTGAYVSTFVASGSGGLNTPEGMAFGPDGNLYVSDWTGRILRYDGTTGAFIDVFATASINSPYDVLFGPDLNMYVTNYNTDEVVRFDGATGALLGVFVSSGSGGLNRPEQATFGPDGNLYVASYSSNEVLRYNGATGAFIDTFVTSGGAADLDRPTGLTFGPDGNLYVADFLDDVILRFNGTTGGFIDQYVAPGSGGLTEPTLMTFIPEQQVTVVP